MKRWSNVQLFYLFCFFRDITFFTPVIYLFWSSRGLSALEIFSLQALFQISVAVLEVPTGILADRFGEKAAILLSVIFWMTGNLIYPACQTFWQMLIPEIMCGCSISLLNGAQQSFIFKSLKNLGQEKHYLKAFGHGFALRTVGSVLGAAGGGFVASWFSLSSTFFFTAAFSVLALITVIRFKQPKNGLDKDKPGYYQIFCQSLELIKREIAIRRLIIFGGIIGAAVSIFFWAHQPYLKDACQMDAKYFGLAFAGLNIVSAMCSKLAWRAEKMFGFHGSLALLAILTPLMPVLAGLFPSSKSYLILFIHQPVRALATPIIDHELIKEADEHNKATVVSFKRLLQKGLFFALAPLFGLALDHYTVTSVFLFSGLLCSLIISFTLWRYLKSKWA